MLHSRNIESCKSHTDQAAALTFGTVGKTAVCFNNRWFRRQTQAHLVTRNYEYRRLNATRKLDGNAPHLRYNRRAPLAQLKIIRKAAAA
jgi:hypothetical protein